MHILKYCYWDFGRITPAVWLGYLRSKRDTWRREMRTEGISLNWWTSSNLSFKDCRLPLTDRPSSLPLSYPLSTERHNPDLLLLRRSLQHQRADRRLSSKSPPSPPLTFAREHRLHDFCPFKHRPTDDMMDLTSSPVPCITSRGIE